MLSGPKTMLLIELQTMTGAQDSHWLNQEPWHMAAAAQSLHW